MDCQNENGIMMQCFTADKIIVGIDEVGRGAIAGPVVACAIILSRDEKVDDINDSKQLSPLQRERISQRLLNNKRNIFAISIIDNNVIDEINILEASLLAMKEAFLKLEITCKNNEIEIDGIIVDGNKKPLIDNYNVETIIKGDCKYYEIAASSIIAKVYRDKLMTDLCNIHPHYFWNSNAGYPTKKHKEAIGVYGITDYHRKTFSSCKIM